MTTSPPIRRIFDISFPRSGHHLLMNYLEGYIGDGFRWCDNNTCCAAIPCIHPETVLQKNHDFRLDAPVLPGEAYVFQYRDPYAAIVSWYEFDLSYGFLDRRTDSPAQWQRFLAEKTLFWCDLVVKWAINGPADLLVLPYDTFSADPAPLLRQVLQRMLNGDAPDEARLAAIIAVLQGTRFMPEQDQGAATPFRRRDISGFRYFRMEDHQSVTRFVARCLQAKRGKGPLTGIDALRTVGIDPAAADLPETAPDQARLRATLLLARKAVGMAFAELGNIAVAATLASGSYQAFQRLELTQLAAATLIHVLERDLWHPELERPMDLAASQAPGFLRAVAQLLATTFPLLPQGPQSARTEFMAAASRALCLSLAQDHQAALDIYRHLQTVAPGEMAWRSLYHDAELRRRGVGRFMTLKGRFCPEPFQRLDVLPGGWTTLCCAAWMPMTTGNAFASTADAWNGDRAQAIRGSILDGSFRHCDKSRCPAIQEATLRQTADLDPVDEIEAAILEGRTNLPWLPKKIDLSHDKSCNLSCPSCRTEMIVLKERERDELVERTERHLLPLLQEADYVNITGSGDPFASKAFRNLLARLSAQDFPNLKIQLASNAVLFDDAAWAQMEHLRGRISQLHISIDAATPETYAVLRRGGDWDRLMRNLNFLARLHAEGAFGSMKLVFVMQEMNFEEMPAFVRLARSLGKVGTHFSALQNWGTYSDGDYMARAIHLPDHPRHRELRAVLARAEFDGADVVLGDLSSLRGTRPAVAAE